MFKACYLSNFGAVYENPAKNFFTILYCDDMVYHSSIPFLPAIFLRERQTLFRQSFLQSLCRHRLRFLDQMQLSCAHQCMEWPDQRTWNSCGCVAILRLTGLHGALRVGLSKNQ